MKKRFFQIILTFLTISIYAQTLKYEERTVRLENEILQVEISSKGAELKSIKHIKTNTEYLWQGDTNYWNQTSPVLFPFIGKSWNDEIHYNDKTYPMKLHGFASKKNFKLIKKSDNEAWFLLEANEETLKVYPFNFQLYVGFILEENKLKVQWNVENKDNKQMFFQVGGHTGFQLPDFNVNDSIFGFVQLKSKRDSIHYIVKEAGGYFTKKPTQYIFIPNSDDLFPLTKEFFKYNAVIFENNQAHEVLLFDKNKNPLVAVTVDTPVFALWTANKKAPFLCIEPWCGIPDTKDNTQDVSQRKWMQRILPNESFTSSYTIEIITY